MSTVFPLMSDLYSAALGIFRKWYSLPRGPAGRETRAVQKLREGRRSARFLCVAYDADLN
jgi:hypothetical protein